MNKKIICLGIILVMVVVMAMMLGCTSDSLQSQIDELTERNEQLEEELDLKNIRIRQLESERRKVFGVSIELENQIKQDFYEFRNDSNFTIEDVYIHRYYGIYNGSVAVKIAMGIILPSFPNSIIIEVEDFEFWYNEGAIIRIWKEGNFYSLENAYNEGFLTFVDLEKIHSLHTV